MPYVTKVKRKGKSTRAHYKTRKDAYSTAKRALREVNKLKAASGPNLIDLENLDVFDLAGTGQVEGGEDLNSIAQGDAEFNRTGDFINLRSIHIDGSLSLTGSASTNVMCHMAIVRDTQTDPSQVFGTNLDYGTVFETKCLVSGAGLYNIRRQDDSLGRFKVVSQKLLRLDTASQKTTHFTMSKYYKGTMKIEYNGTAVGDIQKNAHYFIARCDVVDADKGTDVPILSTMARIRFDP